MLVIYIVIYILLKLQWTMETKPTFFLSVLPKAGFRGAY